MGLFSTLASLGALTNTIDKISGSAKDKLKISDNDISTIKELYSKAKSISSLASKYIVEYPVLISENVSEYDKALSLAKYIESRCAEFIILASGLTPILNTSKDSIGSYINNFGHAFEGFTDDVKLEFDKMSMENYYRMELLFDKLNSESVIYKSLASTEEQQIDVFNTKAEEVSNDDDDVEYDPNSPSGISKVDKDDPKKKEEAYRNSITANNTLLKLNKIPPTVITLKMKFDNNSVIQDVEVPLVVKSRMHYISDEEMVSFLESLVSTNNKMLNIIKLTTGEISFFKDFILRLNSIKKDISIEKKLGRYPFFRTLMDNKNLFKFKKIIKALPKFNSVAEKENIMPSCTLIITKSELETALKMKFSYIINNQKYINKIIDSLMILCLGIYDDINDVIHIYFNGVKDSEIIKMKDLNKEENNGSNKLMSDLIKMASRR